MFPPNQKPPGRSIGKGMLIVSFSLGLIALTMFFDGVLQSQSNPNSEPEFNETDNGIKEVVLQRNRQGHYVANGTINGVPVTLGACVEMDFSSSLPGDLNDDGLVNVLDVVVLVNIVLGQADQDPAGDLNGDGLINVLDVVILVNIILGG